METLGAMTMGGAVSDTIRKKIVNIEQFDANTTSDGEFYLLDINKLKNEIQNKIYTRSHSFVCCFDGLSRLSFSFLSK